MELSAIDLNAFRERGYVVVRNVVPPGHLEAAIAAIFDFLGMDPGCPDDWYRPPLPRNGLVELYQHQALWDNRQFPRVYDAFVQVLHTPHLWVSIDRMCFLPPVDARFPGYDQPGFIHWDIDTSRLPEAAGVQGVLSLTDTEADQGGFQCVPELYACLRDWIARQPANRDPRRPDLSGFRVEPVPTRAGDLIIWSQLLPHGHGRNVSRRPRLAQYIRMFPAAEGSEQERRRRIRLWRYRLAPETELSPGDERRVEQRRYDTAELSSLGRRLLGLEPWI